MPSEAVAIAAIVMSGVVLSVVAWQLLAVACTAVGRTMDERSGRLRDRVHALEKLHGAEELPDHERSGAA